MCGRFFIRLDDSEIARKIKESLKGTQSFEYATNEVFPSQKAIVLILKDDEIMADVKKWGISARSLLINARIETLQERITYKRILHHRCAIIANGFMSGIIRKKSILQKKMNPIFISQVYIMRIMNL